MLNAETSVMKEVDAARSAGFAALSAATGALATPPVIDQGVPTLDSLPRRFADFDTFGDALDYAAKGVRGACFYSARGERKSVLTYRELRQRAQDWARRLIGQGVRPGDRVALIAETSPEFMIGFCAAIYAGALPTPLPLPTSFGGREGYVEQIANQLTSCDPVFVLTPEGLLDLVTQAARQRTPTSGSEAQALVLTWADVSTLAASNHALPKASPQDVAYLQYSSGSTRFPHGIEITHAALMANCHGQAFHGIGFQDTDRGISWLPFYHDMGLVGCFLTTLACQLSVDYLPTDEFVRRPLTWLRLISDNPYTSLSYSPAFGYDITSRRAGSDVVERFDLSRWRIAGNGGDMIRPDVMQTFVDTFSPAGFSASAFMPSYGLAETTLGVTFTPNGHGIRTDLVDERILSGVGVGHGVVRAGQPVRYRAVVNCGKPMPGHKVEIRDGDGSLCGEHSIGRVFVQGPSVMHGYFRDPDLTAAVLSPDGWLDTGDMGYRIGDDIFIVGRVKDMIIINGKNHYPQDVEWAVEQMDGLRSGDVAAFGVTSDSGEEYPVVLVQCRVSDLGERVQLRERIKSVAKAATGMACEVALVPPRALPRTSSGKLSRSKARTLYLSGEISALDVAAA